MDNKEQEKKQKLVKVVEAEQKESPYRRVAKFLYLIGVEQAARVLRNLTSEQISKVVAELVTIRGVPAGEAEEILQEFSNMYAAEAKSRGGVHTARNMLTKAFGEEKAAKIIERSVPVPAPRLFDFLDDIDTPRLTTLLHDELPATKAVVLSAITPAKAAEYIQQLDEEEQKATVTHLAKMESLGTEVLSRVHEALQQKFIKSNVEKTESLDGRSVLANILRESDAEFEQEILQELAETNPELEADIQKRLFTLDDFLRLKDIDAQKILQKMSDDEIALLIYDKSTAFRKKVLTNISKNRAQYILLDEQNIDPDSYSLHETKQASDAFLARLRHAKKNDEIAFLDAEDEWIE